MKKYLQVIILSISLFAVRIYYDKVNDDCSVDMKLGKIEESIICYKSIPMLIHPEIKDELLYVYLDKDIGISDYKEAEKYLPFFNKREKIQIILEHYNLTDESRAYFEMLLKEDTK